MRRLVAVLLLAFTAEAEAQCTVFRIATTKERRLFHQFVPVCPRCNPYPEFFIVSKGTEGTADGLIQEGGVMYFVDVKWDSALLPHFCHGLPQQQCVVDFVFDVPFEVKVPRAETTVTSCF